MLTKQQVASLEAKQKEIESLKSQIKIYATNHGFKRYAETRIQSVTIERNRILLSAGHGECAVAA